ncbi:MAG: peptide deformylase [Bacteroidota bacterium]
MKLPILAFGHPTLRKIAEPISKDYSELNELIADMFETMYSSKGVGLAAPQIGKSIRLIVIDTSPFAEDYPDGKYFKKVFINAKITDISGANWIFNEGCLSVPELREDVTRSEKIHIEYYDQNFVFQSEDYEGIRSRVIQHEYDHLQGILFVDRVSSLKKMLIKRRLSEISKGMVNPPYKMIFPYQKKR